MPTSAPTSSLPNSLSGPGQVRLPPSPRALTQRLVIASIISMLTLAVVCGFGISSLRRLSALSDTEVAQRMTLLNESEVFQLVLFQKGFAVDYMFTGDERWLRELERSRKEFAEWLPQTQRTADSSEERDLLRRIDEAYRALDRERSDMLARYKDGRIDEVKQSLQRTHTMMQSLVSLSQEFVHAASAQARSERDAVQSTMRRDTTLLLGGSLFGMVASLLVGFLVARRVARPIYELQLQVESAAQRTRIEGPPGRAGFEALGEHMGAILRKLEETDAAIAEQRRRLIQTEKMSAIGETTAKLAHEILNPLTGIKAAVQLLARTRDEGPAALAARDTAHVISSEIARVEQLVRRLLTYARPLSPRLQLSEVAPLCDLASDAARSELARAGVTLVRSVAESLPAVEVDPVLLTQALSNLLINAAQASAPGAQISIRADQRELDGQRFVSIRILDEGPGITPEVLPKLFQPFFTTKPHGNGLGLVISQHIAREHGGSLFARDISGIEVLQRVLKLAPETKVILISAHATIESAVEAMKLGGYDFIRKPFELEEIVTTVRNAARTSELEGRVDYLARRARQRTEPGGLVSVSPNMAEVLREVELIARSPVQTVLIQGESGTGKQLVAQMLHERSPRSSGPFVELNCSTLPDTLVESELFGHERGAFSDARERKLGLIEIADGGTLFLDEIGDLSASAQAKLLTFLEQRTFRRVGATALRRVDVRVVAATNRDLRAMAAHKTFRGDLLYRLNAITVELPPLRQRPADVLPPAEHFLLQFSQEYKKAFRAVSPRARALLVGYPWPGNVRELKAVIGRAALLYTAATSSCPSTCRWSCAARASPAPRARARRARGLPRRRPMRRRAKGETRSRPWKRSRSRTSGACSRCAAATARWRRSTWGSRGRPCRAAWKRRSAPRVGSQTGAPVGSQKRNRTLSQPRWFWAVAPST